jgi:nucleotide-binding universal stress UspA family protein
MTDNQQDQYSFWRRRMAGEVVPIHDGDPQAGFYRLTSKEGQSQPVAYWFTRDGALRCRIGNRDVEEQIANERWPWASKHPITHEVYKSVMDGNPWPDQHEAVIRDRQNSAAAPDDNSFEALQDRIEDLARDADALIKAGAAADQDAANRASDLANRLGELQKKADAARAEEKKPHDDAAKEVQTKWRPLLNRADIYRDIKLHVITPFLQAEARRQREAEEAARKAVQEAAAAGAPIPDAQPVRAAPKAGSAGRRSVALRSVKVVTITDRSALLAFFANSERITELLQDMAEKAVRAGAEVPGVNVTEEQRAA